MINHSLCEHENSKSGRAKCRRQQARTGAVPTKRASSASKVTKKKPSKVKGQPKTNPALCPHLESVIENGEKWCSECGSSLIRWGNATTRFNPAGTQKRSK